MSTRDQEAAVDHLLKGLDKHLLKKSRQEDWTWHLNSTGDGFLLAIGAGVRLDELIPALFNAARALVGHCRRGTSEGLQFQIRAALHQGELHVEIDRLPGGFSIGKGLNWSARLASLASASQVIVSEELAQEVRDKLDERAFDQQLHPSRNSDPFEATVKHGHPARFRFLKGTPKLALSQDSSDRLKLLQRADDHTLRALSVVNELIESLFPVNTKEGKLGARYTLWVPRNGEMPASRELVRLPRALGENERLSTKRRTRYPLDDANGGGPLCRAFETGRAQVLCGLPAWGPDESQRAAYKASWRETGVTEDQVDAFSRHARCVLAIPLALEPITAGVLCIDFAQPFDSHEELLHELCQRVIAKSGQFMASLLLLREG